MESAPCSCSGFHRLAFPCSHMGHHPYISTCICGNRVYSLNAYTDPRVENEFLYKWHLYSDTMDYLCVKCTVICYWWHVGHYSIALNSMERAFLSSSFYTRTIKCAEIDACSTYVFLMTALGLHVIQFPYEKHTVILCVFLT